MNRRNAPRGPSSEGEVALGQDHIYLMGDGVYMVGGTEKRLMTRIVAGCDLDLPVMQEGNEVAAAAAAEQRVGRSMSVLVSYHNHRHLC